MLRLVNVSGPWRTESQKDSVTVMTLPARTLRRTHRPRRWDVRRYCRSAAMPGCGTVACRYATDSEEGRSMTRPMRGNGHLRVPEARCSTSVGEDEGREQGKARRFPVAHVLRILPEGTQRQRQSPKTSPQVRDSPYDGGCLRILVRTYYLNRRYKPSVCDASTVCSFVERYGSLEAQNGRRIVTTIDVWLSSS